MVKVVFARNRDSLKVLRCFDIGRADVVFFEMFLVKPGVCRGIGQKFLQLLLLELRDLFTASSFNIRNRIHHMLSGVIQFLQKAKIVKTSY